MNFGDQFELPVVLQNQTNDAMDVDLVLASCGKAVPYFDFMGERDDLKEWAERIGEQGVNGVWERKNQVSMDGKPTGIIVSELTVATRGHQLD